MKDRRMTVTEAARNFADLVSRSFYKGDSTILMKSGEPVAKIVPIGDGSRLGRDLAARWRDMVHLSKQEAAAFADDVEGAREKLRLPSVTILLRSTAASSNA